MDNLKGELLRLDLYEIKPNYSELARIYGKDRRTIKKIHETSKNGGEISNPPRKKELQY